MTYRFIVDSANVLSEEIDQEAFHFYSTVLNGVPEQRERWERGVMRVGSLSSLGEAIGQVYVQRHFPESAKVQMDELVENLRAALRQSIEQNDWMSADTKGEAYKKLEAFRPKIAYPDEWRDFSSIAISRDNLFQNAQNIRLFNYEDEIGRLGQPTDREEWGMTPQTVNAYYNPSFNEIVFPAGILQPPFFDPAADLAVNYGGIGAVIGHEMGHGFDDQGSKSDWRGVQRNWWTDTDRDNFESQADALAEQYSQFEPVPGYFIDGRFTLGENIGDVGGLSLAYRAYRMALNGEEAPVIEGLTGDQRFFLAWAQVWQRKYREDALIQRLTTDPHSPSEFRVNGVVRNFNEWYEAFNVQADEALYLPPEQRIRICRSIGKKTVACSYPFFALKTLVVQGHANTMKMILHSLAFLAISTAMLPLYAVAQESFDLLIKNGRIVDGTGTPWYEADVGIVGDRITRVGNLSEATAPQVIDATGLIVAPGFIDPHTHALRGIFDVPNAESALLQGVTTLTEGNDGSSPYPIDRH